MSAPRPSEADVEARDALWSKHCPFCPIIEGDAPAKIVERGDRHIAFVPLGPHVPGHVLFVPTEHLPDATVNPDRTGAIVAQASRYVAENGMSANIITSIGTAATQSVPHLHVHVVPRGAADGLDPRWPWLAARYAEHEREVAALRADRDEWGRKAEERLQAEVEVKRDLADLRAAIEALVEEWEAIDGEPATDRDLAVMTIWNRAGRQVRALLPRDDAAGAGGGA